MRGASQADIAQHQREFEAAIGAPYDNVPEDPAEAAYLNEVHARIMAYEHERSVAMHARWIKELRANS